MFEPVDTSLHAFIGANLSPKEVKNNQELYMKRISNYQPKAVPV